MRKQILASIFLGGKKRAGGGGGVQDGSINDTARAPAGPYSGDDDTRERKRRETVTKPAERRHEKKRAREGDSLEDTARGPAGPHSGDDNTQGRGRRGKQ